MIGRIQSIREDDKGNLMLLGKYFEKGEMQEDMAIALSSTELESITTGIKLKNPNDLVGMDVYVDKDVPICSILLDLKAHCELSVSATPMECPEDVVGVIQECKSGNLTLQTLDDNRQVVCYMSLVRLHELREDLGLEDLSFQLGVYSHQTKKAYIAFKVE